MSKNILKIAPYFYLSKNTTEFCQRLLSGAISSSISKTLIAPLETIRLRMQVSDELLKQKLIKKPYKSISDTYKKIVEEEGYPALYKGNLYNVLLYFPVQSVNFAIKPIIKNFLINNGGKFLNNNIFLLNLLTGSLTGTSTAFIFQPFEYAKTKITADVKKKLSGKKSQYNGIIDVFKKEYKKYGITTFYRGVSSSVICMFIYRGFYFGLYDTLNNAIQSCACVTKYVDVNNSLVKLFNGFLATSVAGFTAYPFESIRKKVMIDHSYNNSYDCAKKIFKKYGIMKFYKGSSAMVLRGLAGASILVMYEKINNLL